MSVCDPGWKRALLEGVPAPGLAEHVATCEGCRTLHARIDVIERLAADLPVPPVPARLVARLRQEHARVVSRGEMTAPIRQAQPQSKRPQHADLEASEENTPGQVGDLLRHYRAAARLTQEELAALTGLSHDAVSALERGVRRAPRRAVLALADALQLGRREREALLNASQQPVPGPAAERAPAPLLLPPTPPIDAFVASTTTLHPPMTVAEMGRSRIRREFVDRTILTAAAELIAEHGYDGFSMAALADRAGVTKTTVYRRWPSRSHLILATLASVIRVPIPDSGDLRADLVAFARALTANLRALGARRLVAELALASAQRPELTDPFSRLYNELRADARAILQRAQAAGELRASVDPDVLVDQLSGAMHYRMLLLGDGPSDAYAERLVDSILEGVLQHRSDV